MASPAATVVHGGGLKGGHHAYEGLVHRDIYPPSHILREIHPPSQIHREIHPPSQIHHEIHARCERNIISSRDSAPIHRSVAREKNPSSRDSTPKSLTISSPDFTVLQNWNKMKGQRAIIYLLETSTTKNFGRPSRLKYEDKICDTCGIKLAVRIAGSRSPNYQKLYYACERDGGFMGWANPINEDDVSIREEVSTSEKTIVDRQSYKDDADFNVTLPEKSQCIEFLM
ncbi:proline-rich family protein [Striga asiatica]|uniref:Proline-rich family protein n=1 Tax=Striga asiatica TaxID=4170 RepID=A0A5A7PYT9_STRAF|nr:proline-rich family protein [Striga asiatica]